MAMRLYFLQCTCTHNGDDDDVGAFELPNILGNLIQVEKVHPRERETRRALVFN